MCVLVFMPGSDVPSLGWMENLNADKAAHFVLFGILILLTFLPILKSAFSEKTKKQYLYGIALSAVAWGLLTEVIQHYFIAGRTFDLWDWVADSAGILVGVWIIVTLRKTIG